MRVNIENTLSFSFKRTLPQQKFHNLEIVIEVKILT